MEVGAELERVTLATEWWKENVFCILRKRHSQIAYIIR